MGEESAYRRSKATAAIRRPHWAFLHEFVQKVLNKVYISKSVHFKKTVVRILFLSKLWYFQYKLKQKVPQF